ncbi:MAG: FkbM family methyltransferase [Alphaproteobacteria bacterium]
MSAQQLKETLGLSDTIKVVDVGANPIDTSPPYLPLYERGLATVVGFEPNKAACEQLKAAAKEGDAFFPFALGDGNKTKFNVCHAPGMSSNFDPNIEFIKRFQLYPEASQVKEMKMINTIRLDDIPEAANSDMVKIDVQGSELRIFENATEVLKDVVVIHTEAMFVPIYKNQPLFADQDSFLREQGFVFHTMTDIIKRAYRPLLIKGDNRHGLNQLCTADVVYYASWERMYEMPLEKLLKLALIMDQIYNSYDLAQAVLKVYDEREGSDLWTQYMKFKKFMQ